MDLDLWKALAGAIVGFTVGLTGMGGGALLTPILGIVFGVKPTYAVGTDILRGAVFKSFGAVRHRRLGNVHAHLTLWMFAGSGPMSLLGVAVSSWLSRSYGDGVHSAIIRATRNRRSVPRPLARSSGLLPRSTRPTLLPGT